VHPSAFILWLFCSCRTRWTRRLLHILFIPGQVTLVTILLITRPLNSVKLVRVDNQLRVDTETAQCLIHLLSTLHRHVEVAIATEEQRGRLDSIGVQKRIRKLLIYLPRFWIPGWANLVVVLNDVLVSSVERHCERCACSTGCSLESIVARNQVVSQYAAVTPATNSQSVRISDAHLNYVIDASL